MKYIKKFFESKSDLIKDMEELSFILKDEGFSVNIDKEPERKYSDTLIKILINGCLDLAGMYKPNSTQLKSMKSAMDFYPDFIIEYVNRIFELVWEEKKDDIPMGSSETTNEVIKIIINGTESFIIRITWESDETMLFSPELIYEPKDYKKSSYKLGRLVLIDLIKERHERLRGGKLFSKL